MFLRVKITKIFCFDKLSFEKTVEILCRISTVEVLLSHQDSNLVRQNQKLQCYHYTMRQSLGFISKAVQRYDFFLFAKTFLEIYSEMVRLPYSAVSR
jgi:hypothetical protein